MREVVTERQQRRRRSIIALSHLEEGSMIESYYNNLGASTVVSRVLCCGRRHLNGEQMHPASNIDTIDE